MNENPEAEEPSGSDFVNKKAEQFISSERILQGRKIGLLRNKADFSPIQMCAEAGISLEELLAIETGTMELTDDLKLKFAIALKISYSELSANP